MPPGLDLDEAEMKFEHKSLSRDTQLQVLPENCSQQFPGSCSLQEFMGSPQMFPPACFSSPEMGMGSGKGQGEAGM